MAHENIKWTETLPAVLGLRVAVKPDINASSAELVYGVSLRLPAEICTDTSSMPLDYGFVQQLKNQMNHLKPLSTSTHGFSKIFVHPKLDDCFHVFLCVDKVSPSLSQPYTGPHEVLSRNDKHITININGKKSCVSLDRVKPAFVFKDLPDTIPDPIISTESSHRHPVTTNMQTTKSGRLNSWWSPTVNYYCPLAIFTTTENHLHVKRSDAELKRSPFGVVWQLEEKSASRDVILVT
ncbi:retrovirus-related Pol polyprotein from transposon 412 [Trichonephila clavipes]|nr:retrovirus-related Pol polyprotein from transposon 412 [Trichonephila clavipes]